MKKCSRLWVAVLLGCSWMLAGCGQEDVPGPEVDDGPSQLVFVGDSLEQVTLMLGEPNIQFPKSGTEVRWYAGYEVTLSNQIVTAVVLKPVETEEERQEKIQRARMAEQRLRDSYKALKDKEDLSYEAWQKREKVRLQEERAKRARVEAYNERKAKEDRTRIIADAIKSCGCRRGHYCHRCR